MATAAAARLAGVNVSADTSATDPAPIPATDPESLPPTHTITARPSRASLPLNRRASRKSILSQRSRPSLHAHTDHDRTDPAAAPVAPGPQYSATTHSLPSAPPGPDDDDDDDDDDPTQHPPGDAAAVAAAVAAAAEEEDLPWGPSHPCFPHPNPHVVVVEAGGGGAGGAEEGETTRVIRVRRDWLVAGDAYPHFQNVYPEILAEWVTEEEFRELVEGVNRRCRDAFDPGSWRSGVDAVLSLVTGFVWDDLGWTGVKGRVRALEEWMERWNGGMEAQGREARLVPLRRTGFMNLDIVIPDPGIDFVDDGL